MNVIILAGGLGTRLHPITKDKYPKCMVDINGKPFLEYLLEYLTKFNAEKIILSVGHKSEYIENYFGYRYKNIELAYAKEDELLGTGGAIKNSLSLYGLGPFIVLNGDNFINIDINKMIEFYKEKKAVVVVAVKFVGDVSSYGHVVFDKNEKIVEYIEKDGKMPGFVNAGAYIIDGVIRSFLQEKCSFEKDFLQKSAAGVYAFEGDFNFIDIGTPEGYEKFVRQTIKKNSF